MCLCFYCLSWMRRRMHFGCWLFSWRMFCSVIAIHTTFMDVIMLNKGYLQISWKKPYLGKYFMHFLHCFRNDIKLLIYLLIVLQHIIDYLFLDGRIVAHLEQLEFDVSLVVIEWFLCLFAKSFPYEVSIKISFKRFCNWMTQLI